MKPQLKTRQICLFFIAFMPITKLYALPSVLAEITSEDLWLSVIINLLIDLVTIVALIWVSKKTNLTIIEMLNKSFGKVATKIILFIYALIFLLKMFIPLQEQKDFVKLSLYINMPTDLFFLPFFLISFYLATKPMRAIGRSADILWVFTLVGYLLLIVLSVSNVDWSALLPIGARGINNITKGSLSSFTWWGDCLYFIFFIGNYKTGKKDFVKITLSYLVGGIMVILAMIFFWGTFTSIAFRQRCAMTELSKYTTVIYNTGRFDYVGILFIIFSSIFALSLPIYFATQLLQEVFNLKNRWYIALPINVIMAVLMITLSQHMATLGAFIMNKLSIVFLLASNLLPLLTIFLVYKRRKNENF